MPSIDVDRGRSPEAKTGSFQSYHASDMLDPAVEKGAAQFWADEYHRAMSGDKTAQADIQNTTKSWHELPAGCKGEQQVQGLMSNLYKIDPEAAKFFNAEIEHDGSISFGKSPNDKTP
jgi:hypothetical protein